MQIYEKYDEPNTPAAYIISAYEFEYTPSQAHL